MTLTLMKSSWGKVAGVYLHIQWNGSPSWGSNSSAFVLSVENQLKLTPTDNEKAAFFYSQHGPMFGGYTLSVSTNEMMNAPGNCKSFTKGCNDYYNVPADAQGNSILTGDGEGKDDDEKTFTLAAIETWAVTY